MGTIMLFLGLFWIESELKINFTFVEYFPFAKNYLEQNYLNFPKTNQINIYNE